MKKFKMEETIMTNKKTMAIEAIIIAAIIIIILMDVWIAASWFNVIFNNGSSEAAMNIWSFNFFRLFH